MKTSIAQVVRRAILTTTGLLLFALCIAAQVDHAAPTKPKQSDTSPEVPPAVEPKGNAAPNQPGIEVLSDTMGTDFGPYLKVVRRTIEQNWYIQIPQTVHLPIVKKGKVGIGFTIVKDGSVAGMHVVSPSGDVAFDRAAWTGIAASSPFSPFPPNSRDRISSCASFSTTTPSSGSCHQGL